MEISRLDSLEFEVLNFPYNKIASELSNVQRLVHGQNMYVTLGGKLCKRPGTLRPLNSFGGQAGSGLAQIADKMWIYETLDNPPQVYILGSFRTGSNTWEVRYLNTDYGATWLKIPDLRNINQSTVPHELVVHRGLAFIKGVPNPTWRINSGGPFYLDPNNIAWAPDVYDSGSVLVPVSTSHAMDLSLVSGSTDLNTYVSQTQVTTIALANPPIITYQVPVPAGLYDVNLFFADFGHGSGANVMKIQVQGVTVQATYDPYAAAGGASYKATVVATTSVNAPVNAPVIRIDLTTTSPSMTAYINAVEIAPHSGTGDTLGSVIFDGSGALGSQPRTKPWGLLGPQVPAGVTNPAGWSASKHNFDVNVGWTYVFCYVTNTGQVSNRSPLQTDIAGLPSNTGAFSNKIPIVNLTGLADTTDFPLINVYRAMDGGGTFYFLQQVPNTGAGTIVYKDNNLFTSDGGGTRNDPIPDNFLDTSRIAPSLVSNSPPPTTIPPNVTGLASVTQSTPMATYAGRIWYGIGNYLYYSGLEEIGDGIPPECFPSGVTGNYFVFSHPIENVVALQNALLVVTNTNTQYILGQSKETFIPVVFLNDIGAPPQQPRAITTFNDSLVYLTQDYRIALITDGKFTIISDPLFDDLSTAIDKGGQISIDHWAQLDKDYILVNSMRADNVSLSQQWVYDVKKSQILTQDFWFTPWSIKATASVSGRINLKSSRYQLFWVWDGANGVLVQLDPTGTVGSDYLLSGATGYPIFFDTHVMHNPAGNHVNILSEPPRTPIVEFLQMTRSLSPSDSEPDVALFADDLWTTPIPLRSELSMPNNRFPRTNLPKGFKEAQYNYHGAAQKVAFRISKPSTTELFEIQRLLIGFDPAAGS